MSFDEMSNAAFHVMENAKVPKFCFARAAGVILIKAKEAGFYLSGTKGGGLLLKKNEDGWSNPVATQISAAGIGAVIGFAEKDVVIVLNHFAMEKFTTSNFKLDVSLDLGATVGKYGASGEAAIGVSDNARVATAFVYAYQKGAIVNIEANFGGIGNYSAANTEMYGTDDPEKILSGKALPKDAAKVEEILQKFKDYTTKAE